MEEDWELAPTFQSIAESDRTEYFAREAELAGFGKGTKENLRTAIVNHIDQVKMYTRFEEAATANGDAIAAELFEKVARAKLRAQTDLEAALQHLGHASSVHLIEA